MLNSLKSEVLSFWANPTGLNLLFLEFLEPAPLGRAFRSSPQVAKSLYRCTSVSVAYLSRPPLRATCCNPFCAPSLWKY